MATERARYFAAKWPGRVMGWEVLQEAHSGAGFAQIVQSGNVGQVSCQFLA